MPFYYLAIQEAHDASAALMMDGEIIAAVQEERFSRLKGDYGYPEKSIDYCLKHAGIEANQLSAVLLCSVNWNPVLVKIKRNANFTVADWVKEQEEYWAYELGMKQWEGPYYGKSFAVVQGDGTYRNIPEHKPWNYYSLYKDRIDFKYDSNYPMDHLLNGYMDLKEMNDMRKIRSNFVSSKLGIDPKKIYFIVHEDCHKYYAYYGSKLSDERKPAIVLTNEGIGDYSNCTVSIANGHGNIAESSFSNECHIGHLYQYATLLLGMKPAQHEYKVMGLAPYANKKEVEKSYEVYKDILKVDELSIVFNNRPRDLYFYFREKLHGHRFDGIAGAVQKMTEELLVQWVKNCIEEIGIHNVVLAGGVGQNIKACKAIGEIPELENFDVLPACGDASLPIGACYCYENTLARKVKTKSLQTAYLGTDTIFFFSKSYDTFFSVGTIMQKVADLLADGFIIGRFSGRMEFGSRALGNRSILADPRNIDSVRKINQAIKFRDFWMPFTPTVLDIYADRYIINPKKLNTKFMTMAFDSTDEARKNIPAALHPADFTVRPQVISYEDNPKYYELISRFEGRTGVGALLNTSMNLHGDPIVNSMKDIEIMLENSDIDAVFVNDEFLITKDERM